MMPLSYHTDALDIQRRYVMSDFYHGADLDLQDPADMLITGYHRKHRIFDGHMFRHAKSAAHKLL